MKRVEKEFETAFQVTYKIIVKPENHKVHK